eukprot:TRINITY_DN7523_c0_g1_i8.p1 TRINITY_DN7523_c0_g1~~TRINITY_DN7523_c0_g1_i8.p1  ORF type:complete len:338 (+),score=30.58 TRINITY_DN7523_c0_g1_i8:495-1508(+)
MLTQVPSRTWILDTMRDPHMMQSLFAFKNLPIPARDPVVSLVDDRLFRSFFNDEGQVSLRESWHLLYYAGDFIFDNEHDGFVYVHQENCCFIAKESSVFKVRLETKKKSYELLHIELEGEDKDCDVVKVCSLTYRMKCPRILSSKGSLIVLDKNNGVRVTVIDFPDSLPPQRRSIESTLSVVGESTVKGGWTTAFFKDRLYVCELRIRDKQLALCVDILDPSEESPPPFGVSAPLNNTTLNGDPIDARMFTCQRGSYSLLVFIFISTQEEGVVITACEITPNNEIHKLQIAADIASRLQLQDPRAIMLVTYWYPTLQLIYQDSNTVEIPFHVVHTRK